MTSAGDRESGQLGFIFSEDGESLALPEQQVPDFPPAMFLDRTGSVHNPPRPTNYANLVVRLVAMLDLDAEPEKLAALAEEDWGMEQLRQTYQSKAAVGRKVAELRMAAEGRRAEEQRMFQQLLGVPTLLQRRSVRFDSQYTDYEQFILAIAGERFREFERAYGGRKALNVAARYALARTFVPHMVYEPEAD